MNLAAFGIFSIVVACHLPALPSAAPVRDKIPTDQQKLTKREKIQEENNMICQKSKNSTDYFFEPVQEVCLSCRVCVGSKDQYCEVCNKPTTTVPSLVETPSSPNDSSVTFWESTTKHLQTPETESAKTGGKTTPDEASSSNKEGVANTPPAVIPRTIPSTQEEEEAFLRGINDTESSLRKPHQDTEPVPSCHPMRPNSFSSSSDEDSIRETMV
ncbi:uncharacterized protein LOC117292488 isoform X2 [Asterias rubens]|uniref:uncharacterized protein LOC117292488 isoform X2 n=1 Tax=Asterias rubens TaxID=7604 RepID=UPI001455D8E4|nr:uncharacterized protein LOC117292488 isoform X2 [Asterias rubens]